MIPLLLFAVLQAPAAPAPHHHKTHAAAEAKAKPPAGPKTAVEMQQDLDAALHQGTFADDQITATIEGTDITLHGTVHSAERKGLATRSARELAQKGLWHGYHVFNKIDVELPPLNPGH